MNRTDNNPPNTTAATLAAQGMVKPDGKIGHVVPQINPSSTFARDDNYELISEQHAYARDNNPTFEATEQLLARLENGEDAKLFSSGMAAAMAVVQCLQPGDHIVAPKIMYWGLRNWLTKFANKWALKLDLFDPNSEGDLATKVIAGQTKLVWIETPCNPTWDLIDITQAAEIAHAAGAILAVDSTVATPVLCRPIELGADIVMHSATKYLNGHSDLVAGALVTARCDSYWSEIKEVRAEAGAILGSFESWLLHRGMRTLFVRVLHASRSAMAIATHFQNHPNIRQVLYPGLESHPGHHIAKRQMQGGFGGMLSLCIKYPNQCAEDEITATAALETIKRCQLLVRATSLGGTESLIEHRHSIEGADSPIPKDLLRISVGLETTEDLINDLEQALDR